MSGARPPLKAGAVPTHPLPTINRQFVKGQHNKSVQGVNVNVTVRSAGAGATAAPKQPSGAAGLRLSAAATLPILPAGAVTSACSAGNVSDMNVQGNGNISLQAAYLDLHLLVSSLNLYSLPSKTSSPSPPDLSITCICLIGVVIILLLVIIYYVCRSSPPSPSPCCGYGCSRSISIPSSSFVVSV
jgi:hypothetical protein